MVCWNFFFFFFGLHLETLKGTQSIVCVSGDHKQKMYKSLTTTAGCVTLAYRIVRNVGNYGVKVCMYGF